MIFKFKQDATCWLPDGDKKTSFADRLYLAPKVIKVRWEDKQKLYRDNMDREKISMAVVYTNEVIPIESYLFKGISTEEKPREIINAFLVKGFSIIPNLENTQSLRTYFLDN